MVTLQHLQTSILLLDFEKDGRVKCNDLLKAILPLGLDDWKCEMIEESFLTMDTDGKGNIDGQEFANWMEERCAEVQLLSFEEKERFIATLGEVSDRHEVDAADELSSQWMKARAPAPALAREASDQCEGEAMDERARTKYSADQTVNVYLPSGDHLFSMQICTISPTTSSLRSQLESANIAGAKFASLVANGELLGPRDPLPFRDGAIQNITFVRHEERESIEDNYKEIAAMHKGTGLRQGLWVMFNHYDGCSRAEEEVTTAWLYYLPTRKLVKQAKYVESTCCMPSGETMSFSGTGKLVIKARDDDRQSTVFDLADLIPHQGT